MKEEKEKIMVFAGWLFNHMVAVLPVSRRLKRILHKEFSLDG